MHQIPLQQIHEPHVIAQRPPRRPAHAPVIGVEQRHETAHLGEVVVRGQFRLSEHPALTQPAEQGCHQIAQDGLGIVGKEFVIVPVRPALVEAVVGVARFDEDAVRVLHQVDEQPGRSDDVDFGVKLDALARGDDARCCGAALPRPIFGEVGVAGGVREGDDAPVIAVEDGGGAGDGGEEEGEEDEAHGEASRYNQVMEEIHIERNYDTGTETKKVVVMRGQESVIEFNGAKIPGGAFEAVEVSMKPIKPE